MAIKQGNTEGLKKLLEIPVFYRLSQFIFAPGAEMILTAKIRSHRNSLPSGEKILDVGCGPASWLWKLGEHPVGLDISFSFSVNYHRHGEPAITGSALDLPFTNGSFDGVWSVGVLHHLPDGHVRQAVGEMQRVCKPGGAVIILDAVLPSSPWRRPVAQAIRKLDRGKYMRHEDELTALLPDERQWGVCRYTYAATGLEMMQATFTCG